MRPFARLIVSVGVATAVAASIYVATRPIGAGESVATLAAGGFYPIGSSSGSLAVGELAPEFVAADGSTPILTDLDGRPIRLASLRGRPLWIVFWATWCAPCQQEAAAIRTAFHAHGDAIGVLAIDVREPAVGVRAYALDHDLDYPIALDSTGAVMALYRAGGLPSHAFLDSRGILVDRYFGQLTAALMEEHLQALIGH